MMFPQKIVRNYLKDAVSTRIVTNPPSDVSAPWIKLRRLWANQDPDSPVDWLRECYFQMDCYAGTGGWPEVEAIAEDVRTALNEIRLASHDGAVVTRCRINGDHMLEDDQPPFDPARERVILTATIFMHPA